MRSVQTIARVVLAVFGGYAFTAAGSAVLALALPRTTGMERSEAVLLSAMLAFVVYLVVLLWAFAARRLDRVALILLGGALAGYATLRFAADTSRPPRAGIAETARG
jgi:hypothetical protein